MSDIPFSVDQDPSDKTPVRFIVELVSSAEVKRLEARDDDIRSELEQLRRENEGLRRSFYELLQVFADIKNPRSPQKNK